MNSNPYRPTDWTKLIMWSQLAIVSTLSICLVAAELGWIQGPTGKQPPQYMKALGLTFSILGIIAAASILRGKAKAWWFEAVFLVPIAVFAWTKIPEIRFGQTFTTFMDGIVKSFQVLVWGLSPVECIRIAISLRVGKDAIVESD